MLCAYLFLGCASRSTLHASANSDATSEITVDSPAETYGREASASDCSARATSCPKDDFGPLKGVTAVFDVCNTTRDACGDMTLVFNDDGCLVELAGIQDYKPAFVECVLREASATRWLCAPGKRLQMFQGCPP